MASISISYMINYNEKQNFKKLAKIFEASPITSWTF